MNFIMELIVACTKSGGIGKNNKIPWHIKDDLKLFRKKTTEIDISEQEKKVLLDKFPGKQIQNIVIMGRKTWESIPEKYRPLPNRINFILSTTLKQTSNFITEYPNTFIISSLEHVILKIKDLSAQRPLNKGFIIGGSSLYKEALNYFYIRKLHISYINKEYDCDTYFPLESLKDNFKIEECSQFTDFTYICYNHKN
jgi:dihydrofolate reductase